MARPQANPASLLAELQLIEEFVPEALAIGKEGYALTTLQACSQKVVGLGVGR